MGEQTKNTEKASVAAVHGVCPEAVEGRAKSLPV
jgi:hypothetical protein